MKRPHAWGKDNQSLAGRLFFFLWGKGGDKGNERNYLGEGRRQGLEGSRAAVEGPSLQAVHSSGLPLRAPKAWMRRTSMHYLGNSKAGPAARQ